MLERLFTTERDEAPAPGEGSKGEMRAYFHEKLRYLATEADSRVEFSDAGGRLDAVVTVSIPDAALARVRSMLSACLTVGEMEGLLEIMDEYGEEAMAETSRISSREGSSVETDMADQCVITASVFLSLTFRELVAKAMEGKFDEARESNQALSWDGAADDGEQGAAYADGPGDEEAEWHVDPDAWNPDAPHPDEDYEDALAEDWSAGDGGEGEEREGDAMEKSVRLNTALLEEALATPADTARAVEAFRGIERYLAEALGTEHGAGETTEYRRCLPAAMELVHELAEGALTLEELTRLRNHPRMRLLTMKLSPNEEECCFWTVFDYVAEDVLERCASFREAYGPEHDEDRDAAAAERRHSMKQAYVDWLREKFSDA